MSILQNNVINKLGSTFFLHSKQRIEMINDKKIKVYIFDRNNNVILNFECPNVFNEYNLLNMSTDHYIVSMDIDTIDQYLMNRQFYRYEKRMVENNSIIYIYPNISYRVSLIKLDNHTIIYEYDYHRVRIDESNIDFVYYTKIGNSRDTVISNYLSAYKMSDWSKNIEKKSLEKYLNYLNSDINKFYLKLCKNIDFRNIVMKSKDLTDSETQWKERMVCIIDKMKK